ncbi:MAG TPA: DUF4032 domain-containing protein, partial [Arthrobacter sp.]|nr:DUF4032 domain-containing protein [Arthrobacter sp.]
RWYVSEDQDRNVPLAEAVQSYVDSVLRHRRDEAAIMLNPDEQTAAAFAAAETDEG